MKTRSRRRPNGEGTIYRRDTDAGPRWDIEITDEGGDRRTRRFKTEREALSALKAASLRKDAGLDAMPERHTMGQLFDAWLAYLKQQTEREERSYATWRSHDAYIRKHMRAALGRVDCRRLTSKDVDNFLGALNLSPQTRANQRATLRRALNVALKWGWVDRNVVSQSDPIPVRPREVPALSVSEAQTFLDALKDDALASLFVVALFTGLRAGELAGLRVNDINLQAGTMRVHQQVQSIKGQGLVVKPLKTYASADRVELIPEAAASLSDAIGGRASGYVWESSPGRPYHPSSLTRAFKLALERAGLPHLRLHDLRHLFISFLPQLDVHPSVAQKLARHATIATTMNIYTSVEDSLKKQAMGRLHEALNQQTTGAVTGSRPDGLRAVP